MPALTIALLAAPAVPPGRLEGEYVKGYATGVELPGGDAPHAIFMGRRPGW